MANRQMKRQPGHKRSESTIERESLSPERILLTLRKFNIEIPDSMMPRIVSYLELLVRWNEKINLTAVNDPQLLMEQHFGESLFGAISIGIESGNLLDVGSGAGFPALPIALLRPELEETLLEPSGKKAAFLGEACRTLALSGRVKVVRCRLEEFSTPARFAFITSRAVRVTGRFLQQCSRLLQPEGRLILWLGYDEVKDVTGDVRWKWDQPVRVPGSERRYVISGVPAVR